MSEKDEKGIRIGRRAYIFTALVILVLAGIMCFTVERTFDKQSAKEIVGSLCNCFTVPGVVVGGVGALSYIGRLGGFDGLAYAFTSFGLHNIWVTNSKKKPASFYEYKQAKDEKGRVWFPNLLFCGLGALGVAVLLLIVYLILP